MAGIGRAHLSQIENRAVSAKIDTLHAVAQTLDLKLEELFRGFDKEAYQFCLTHSILPPLQTHVTIGARQPFLLYRSTS
jgi:transcriptional regulator with XRE-family HTH domain